MSPFAMLVKSFFPRDLFDEFEERAAIIQYDGKRVQELAELEAYWEIAERSKRFPIRRWQSLAVTPEFLAKINSPLVTPAAH